jgi:hypothetical protein
MTRRMLALCVMSATVLALGPSAASAQPGSVTGLWQATGVTFAPWTFEFVLNGTTLTGTVRQSGGISTPANIRDGSVLGARVAFKTDSPSGGRIISFDGILAGDSIVFTRSVEDPTGTVGGSGLFGAGGPPRFTVTRARPSNAPPAIAHKEVSYKGFVVDISAVASQAGLESVLTGMHIQLDLVDQLKVPDSVKEFFRSVPLVVLPTSGSALYGSGHVTVPLHSSTPYDEDHPVVLHELCHAYHDKRVPGGFGNARIRELYQQAKDSKVFPAGAYMLTKPGEYFAMMASVYLHGSAARDPFTREAIKAKQPDMYQWLVREFGAQ